LSEARARVRALDLGVDLHELEVVEACNLCGSSTHVVVAHEDRYGFPLRTCVCIDCGLGFLSPRPTADSYASFYRHAYRPLVSAFHGRRIDAETVEEEQRPYAAALATTLEPFVDRDAATLLDVGGSTGVVAEVLARRFGLSAVVLDPSDVEGHRAAARGMEVIVGTAEHFEPAGRTFDVILLCQTIDHLLDPAGVLARLSGILSPGGTLFVDIVDFRAAYLRHWCVEAATKLDHPHSFTEPVTEALLARAGLRWIRKSYAPDHLHVGYLCINGEVAPAALPAHCTVELLLGEIRYVQNTPKRS
jgi:SAM-dependent methyltransferase